MRTKTVLYGYKVMIILRQTASQQTFKCIPREGTATTMTVINQTTREEKSVSIISQVEGDFYTSITGIFSLIEDTFYTLVLKREAKVLFKDVIFCTNQSVGSYTANRNKFTTKTTDNEFIVL